MGKLYEAIDGPVAKFILAQKVFFVATAPSGDGGHINLSPKGLDTLRLVGPRELAYLDFTGSGAETIAHVRENGRIVLMFCAFEGAPRIVRVHGRAGVIEPQDAEFAALRARFATPLPARSILHVTATRIADSCGFGVPLLRYEGDRTQLTDYNERKGADGARAYQARKNAASIDGLPALRWASEQQESPS